MFATIKGNELVSSNAGQGHDASFLIVDSCPGELGLPPILRIRENIMEVATLSSAPFFFVCLEDELLLNNCSTDVVSRGRLSFENNKLVAKLYLRNSSTASFDVTVQNAAWDEKASTVFETQAMFDLVVNAQKLSTRIMVDALCRKLDELPSINLADLKKVLRKDIPKRAIQSSFWIYFSQRVTFNGDDVEGLNESIESENTNPVQEGFYFGFVKLLAEKDRMIVSDCILADAGKKVIRLSNIGSVKCDVVQKDDDDKMKEVRIYVSLVDVVSS